MKMLNVLIGFGIAFVFVIVTMLAVFSAGSTLLSQLNSNMSFNSFISQLHKNPTIAACPEIPANPTKEQVDNFLAMAYNGSACAIAAIRQYNSSGILAKYGMKANMTKLSAFSSNGIYG